MVWEVIAFEPSRHLYVVSEGKFLVCEPLLTGLSRVWLKLTLHIEKCCSIPQFWLALEHQSTSTSTRVCLSSPIRSILIVLDLGAATAGRANTDPRGSTVTNSIFFTFANSCWLDSISENVVHPWYMLLYWQNNPGYPLKHQNIFFNAH